MQDRIYTIPVSEVFEPKEGCPICRMRDTLEQRSVEYIMGAAMMEPDVRQETNRQGFCKDHFGMMLKQKNRLSLALILESHLAEMGQAVDACSQAKPAGFFSKQKTEGTGQSSCYVCAKIDWALERMLSTTVKLYAKEESFQALYRQQEGLCLPHFHCLMAAGRAELGKKQLPEFAKDTAVLTRRYLDSLKEDVSHFCRMFDYRNAGPDADWGNSKDAVERAILYLTSRNPADKNAYCP